MWIVGGDKLPVLVSLTCRTSSHTDTKGDGLLQDEHEHGGQYARTITARRIKQGYFIDC